MSSIYVYGLFQLAAVGLFLAFTETKLRHRGATLIGRPGFVAACVLGAGIGGRLHFVAEGVLTGRLDSGGILAALDPRVPGSTFFGAMVGAIAAVLLRRRCIPGGSIARLLDDVVPGFATAIAVGRIGCLLHGCCLGEPSGLPWAIVSGEGAARHPLPLYIGVAAVAAGFLSARWIEWDRIARVVPGSRFLLFAAIFCAARAWAEGARETGPAPGWAQLESVGIAAGAMAAHLTRRRGHSRTRSPLGRERRTRYASRA